RERARVSCSSIVDLVRRHLTARGRRRPAFARNGAGCSLRWGKRRFGQEIEGLQNPLHLIAAYLRDQLHQLVASNAVSIEQPLRLALLVANLYVCHVESAPRAVFQAGDLMASEP